MDGGGPFYLPEDVWKLIFSHLERRDFRHVSLVSKQYLSTTNQLNDSLTISSQTISQLDVLLQRFQHIKKITVLTSVIPLESVFRRISHSRISLEALILKFQDCPLWDYLEPASPISSLKSLTCFSPCALCNRDFFIIPAWFPELEEITINGVKDELQMVNDYGIEVLASKLKNLKSIVFTGYCGAITDQSLIALSQGCENLAKIHLQAQKHGVTEHGIGFVMRNSQDLTYLQFYNLTRLDHLGDITITNSLAFATKLRFLVCGCSELSDSSLVWMAKANIPLEQFGITEDERQFCTDGGLVEFFKANPSLRALNISLNCLTNKSMEIISSYLHNLTHIQIISSNLTSLAFFILTNNCPFLIKMIFNSTKIGMGDDFGLELKKNPSIRILKFQECSCLNDRTLRMIAWVCPNLEHLEATACPKINGGIGEILNCCPMLLSLILISGEVSENFMAGSGILKMKYLKVVRTNINDLNMTMMATRCPHLEYLNISHSQEVTNSGVMDVVMACKKLRTIKMMECRMLSALLLEWMVLERPTLRVVTSPCLFSPQEN